MAKYANIRVVPIVGGMSSEKQERLLKSRPEIVVGTPGRLWELMSSGAIHLVEVGDSVSVTRLCKRRGILIIGLAKFGGFHGHLFAFL